MINFDKQFTTDSIINIAGIDEAGRGPLAGPVVAAAVIFNDHSVIADINDSKKLSEKKREELFPQIISEAYSYGIGIVNNEEIDEINILQATFRAMQLAVKEMNVSPDLLLIDGNKTFKSDIPSKAIVKGDGKSYCIAAASILAKVTRDRIMIKLADEFPEYDWQQNKGYPTKAHIEKVKKIGPTKYHRRTFLKNILDFSQREFIFRQDGKRQ